MRVRDFLDFDGALRLLAGSGDVEVVGVTHDSRRVQPGFAFFALKGLVTDGHRFAPEAVRRGASAVFVQEPAGVPEGPAVLVSGDTRAALARAAGLFYGHPSRSLFVIGVTGTKGKTTTTHLVRAILEGRGLRTGLMGTVHNVVGGEAEPVVHTTPEAHELQALLARMVRAGDTHVVMEVSSHALELKRVAGTEYDVAVLTNVSHDHLDFHGTLDNYVLAKSKLFGMLGRSCTGTGKPVPKAGIANGDDPAAGAMRQATKPGVRFLTFGFGKGLDVRAEQVELGPAGARFLAVTPAGSEPVKLGLPGRFNVANALAALAVGIAAGFPLRECARALEDVKGVPGRFERVDAGQDFPVIVDYAHSPDSLENVLATARELTRGRLVVVFGCGGDRDRAKRPIMGRIASRLADRVIITSDNPRSEDPETIIGEIAAGTLRGAGTACVELVPDRAQAICRAVAGAGPGDVVLIAGKGHEPYQVFADRTVHFDDREVARQALAGLGFRMQPGGRAAP